MPDNLLVYMTNTALPGQVAQIAPDAVPYYQSIGWVVLDTPVNPAFVGYVNLGPVFDAKGDLLAGTGDNAFARVPVGANGQYLIADSTQALGVRWSTGQPVVSGLIDLKGDLLVGTANDTIARKAVGANGTILTADSAQSDGLFWKTVEASLPARLKIDAIGSVAQVTDANAALENGFYYFTTTTNGPVIDGGGYLFVSGYDATDYLTQIFSLVHSNRVFVRTRSPGTWNPWVELGNRRGSGPPEGVITANVGVVYTDVAATRGAIEWIKETGTGNTGWQVSYGDTGARDVSASLLNGWAYIALPILRRNRSTVRFTAYLNANSASSVFCYLIPTGFRPRATHTGIGVWGGTASNAAVGGLVRVETDTWQIQVSNHGNVGAVLIDMTWNTDNPWPSSLPGSPG